MAKRNFFSSSGNPFMSDKAYRESSKNVLDSDMASPISLGEKMTVQGAVN